jgi:hypothetical protein
MQEVFTHSYVRSVVTGHRHRCSFCARRGRLSKGSHHQNAGTILVLAIREVTDGLVAIARSHSEARIRTHRCRVCAGNTAGRRDGYTRTGGARIGRLEALGWMEAARKIYRAENREMTDRYIWHETINTEHTRRSFLSEVAPDVRAIVAGWLASGDAFDMPGGYRGVIMYRSEKCLQAEILTPEGVRLCVIGVANNSRCGAPLWARLNGDPGAKPVEPWCGAWLDPAGQAADPFAYDWLGDFERCLAWAFLEEKVNVNVR